MFALHDPLDDTIRAELAAYDELTAALLARRGMVTREAAEVFLAPSYDEHIHDPMLMTDMPKAAERLAKAIDAKERITVWSDYDCDGIPGGTLLHDFLKKAGANFSNYIPHRHEEGYGVNVAGIETLAREGTTLVITVDSGITDIEAVARATELGMDVIVTDHHLPGETLPDAFAVVNPNAREDEPYPFKGLCGAGVAWKLACATLAHGFVGREAIAEGWEKWLLDMAGLATIADMVPLTGENRVIARYGLLVLRKSPRIGLQKLCRVMRVNQRAITEDDVAFMIAPRVNAASRMGDPRDAFELFATDDEARAEELAKKLEAANRGRRSAAAAITRAVNERIAARRETGDLPPVIALGDPDWRPALLGLVASGIATQYERPVFLWGREANQSLKGSCRTYGGVHLVELMSAAPDTFAQFGGHAASGGFTLRDDAVFTFEEQLAKAHATLTHERADDLTLHADAVLAPEEATSAFLKRLDQLAPFGEGNPKPVFLFERVVLASVSWFGKGEEHLKLVIERPFDALEAVAFFGKRELGAKAGALSAGQSVSLLANIERDQFSRKNPVRLRVIAVA